MNFNRILTNLLLPIQEGETDVRKIPVPANRYTPLKSAWSKLVQPVVEHLKLQMRFNLKSRNVEIRVRHCRFVSSFSLLTMSDRSSSHDSMVLDLSLSLSVISAKSGNRRHWSTPKRS